MNNTPKHIRIQDYTYHLPDEKIAKFPLAERDASKLLMYKNGSISDHSFTDISNLLPPDSLILFNNTKVIHARLLFQRETGAHIEVFCIEPADHLDYQLAFTAKHTCSWKCMVGNAKRWKDGEVLRKHITTPQGNVELTVTKAGRSGELFAVNFTWNSPLSFAEVLHHAGMLPLPPYLNRDTEESDEDRYQTVYAKVQGSVAAPTAGLHFTDSVFAALAARNITVGEVTLHVGAGTFKPVKSETLAEHEMHEETIFVDLPTLKQLAATLEQGKPIITVGTTSTRTIESLYWHGVKLLHHGADETVAIQQWDAYETETAGTTPLQAIQAIIQDLEHKHLRALQGSTRMVIAPGYTFRLVDVLVTNFHQPENTLILLIAAFVGADWKRIYDHALHNHYRFLSYGDSSVLWKKLP